MPGAGSLRHARQTCRPRCVSDGDARPQRVARRRMGVVGHACRETDRPRTSRARCSASEAHVRCKDQAWPPATPACFGLMDEIAARRIVPAGQPKHASLDRVQQTHPDIEHLRREFVGVVERAEDETPVGKSGLGAAWPPAAIARPLNRSACTNPADRRPFSA